MLAGDATASVHKSYWVFFQETSSFSHQVPCKLNTVSKSYDPWHLGWTVVSALHTEGVLVSPCRVQAKKQEVQQNQTKKIRGVDGRSILLL